MKSNPKQKAVYLALCILAAIVVWIFVDNFGNIMYHNLRL